MIGKKEIKVSLFTDDMIVYIENSKESIERKKKKTPRTSGFSKISGYKISTQNKITFLNIKDEQSGNQR